MHKLLVVYNICGLSNNENVTWYIKCIESILDQDTDDYHVVLSSCMNDPKDIQLIKDHFQDTISYNIVNETLPVNVTFNHSVMKCVEEFGPFKGYLYVDSGVHFDRKDTISLGMSKFNPEVNSMVTLPTENDMGFAGWFGWDFPPCDIVVPVGGACNLHVQIFSHELYKTFNKRIWPDIFASYASESVFSFLNAAIRKTWVITDEIKLPHNKSVDGASLGFQHGNFIDFRSPRSILDIMRDPEAYASGFGFAECPGLQVLMHNSELYDDNLYAKNPQRLIDFINNNIFLSKESLDYNAIIHEFIK